MVANTWRTVRGATTVEPSITSAGFVFGAAVAPAVAIAGARTSRESRTVAGPAASRSNRGAHRCNERGLMPGVAANQAADGYDADVAAMTKLADAR
jgi:hypothetical protein